MNVEGGLGGGVGGVAGAASVVVNEGPVRSLEGFRPMNASDINTIDFKGGTIAPGQPLVIAQAEEVAAAAWEKSELPVSPLGEPTPQEAVSQPEVIIAQVQPAVAPQVELAPALQVSSTPKPETRVSRQITPAVAPQPLLQDQEVEEIVMEKVKVEDPKESLEEEEIVDKRLFLEDEQAKGQRIVEVGEAVKKAKAEGEKLGLKKIAGWLVARFLPAEHPGNRSQVVKEKGPDGSYEETMEAIAAEGEFDSPEQAERKFGQIVAENKPVKQGKEGNPVKNEDVARVFKYRVIKPAAAAYEIVTRRVKKKVQVPVAQVATQPQTETSLEDYPELQEIFQG